jgi:hypothetical protein
LAMSFTVSVILSMSDLSLSITASQQIRLRANRSASHRFHRENSHSAN